eukprot:8277990-Lingulodinium_polyedra.AAC.1
MQRPRSSNAEGGETERLLYYAIDAAPEKNNLTWDMERAREFATVNTPDDELRVLGGTFGGDDKKCDT